MRHFPSICLPFSLKGKATTAESHPGLMPQETVVSEENNFEGQAALEQVASEEPAVQPVLEELSVPTGSKKIKILPPKDKPAEANDVAIEVDDPAKASVYTISFSISLTVSEANTTGH